MIPDLSATLDDPIRLAALRRLALRDHRSEAAFDRLTRLAARVLHVPVALVSLVDHDRQFFLSCVGLPEPWAARREVPLSYSFCKYVVAASAPLIIDDTRTHPLAQSSPAIAELGFLAYIGIPLRTPDGHTIGALCVADRVPRSWSTEEIATAQDLGAVATTEIERQNDIVERRDAEAAVRRLAEQQRVEQALRESEARFSKVFHASLVGISISALADGRYLEVNDRCLAMMGYRREEMVGHTSAELNQWADWADRVRLAEGLQAHGAVHNIETRYRTSTGEVRDALASLELIELDGERCILAMMHDITERKRVEKERERLIVELQAALANIKTLRGLLPICSSCKKVRDDSGYWNQIETYIQTHSDAEFTHGLCPNCARHLYPDLYAEDEKSV